MKTEFLLPALPFDLKGSQKQEKAQKAQKARLENMDLCLGFRFKVQPLRFRR